MYYKKVIKNSNIMEKDRIDFENKESLLPDQETQTFLCSAAPKKGTCYFYYNTFCINLVVKKYICYKNIKK